MAFLDAFNSTVSPQTLGAGATYTGAWRDLTDYEEFTVFLTGDSGASGTLYIDLSVDKSTTDKTRTITVTDILTFPAAFDDVTSNFMRVRYTNGATPLAIFQCQTMLHEKKSIDQTNRNSIDTPFFITAKLVPQDYDYIGYSYTGSNITTITYKLGGSGGTTVMTKTLAYDGSDNITSITIA